MSKSYLLINEPPLTVSPTLAKIIGLDEAVVIQQVHYWLMNDKNAGRIEEGEKWVYNTYEEWQEGNFPFWSADKIQRLFLKLEKQGLIISRQFNAKNRDMRKFYRLAYGEICALHDSLLRPSNTANLHDVNGTETTTENTNTPKIQKTEIKGIEAAMFGNRPVSESDLPIGDDALKAFERDMQCPGSWTWYPAKTSDEPAWKYLREFVVKTYQADPKAFEKYYTWSKQPYSRGAMTVLGIKRNPADFELSWAAFCASDMYSPKQENTNEDGKGFYV